MIAKHKGEIPFALPLLPFISGISTGLWWWPVVSAYLLTVVFAILICVFIILNLAYQPLKLYQRLQWLGTLVISLTLFTGGWLSTTLHNELNTSNHFSKTKAEALLIQLSSEPKVGSRYLRFTATVKQTITHHKLYSSSGNLLVIAPVTEQTRKWRYGDELIINANYATVAPPYNPAEFNYKQYLAYQNIHYQAFVNPGKFVLVQQQAGNNLIAYALRLRQVLAQRLKTGIRDTNASAVASTLILGYKADLSNDVLQAYSKTGTIHVLSVSGAHVAIIYALISFLLGIFNYHQRGRWLNASLAIVLIWAYALLTGFSPAVCRAALMISLFIIAKTFYRHVSTLNILAASAFLLLLLNPFLLADVGFQLSYLAVFGLLAFQPIIYQQLQINNKWLNKLWYLCSASIAAQLITFPLSVYYFHQFPVYFLVSNLFIIIPTEIIMITGTAYLLLYQIPYLSVVLGRLLECTIIGMNKGLSWMEHLPYASAGGLWIDLLELILLALAVVLAVVFLYSRKAVYIISVLACCLMVCISIGFKKYKAESTNSLVFFNLKKNSGIMFKSGRKSVVLTNADDKNPSINYTLQPCLDSNLINEARFIPLNKTVNTAYCRKAGNYIQFLDKSVLLIDSNFNYAPLHNRIKADYLFVTGSSYPDLNLLAKSYVYTTVIADANNSNQSIERLRLQTLKQHKYFVCLKRNKSFVVVSNN